MGEETQGKQEGGEDKSLKREERVEETKGCGWELFLVRERDKKKTKYKESTKGKSVKGRGRVGEN